MSERKVERRLAAILAVDVVGYSRLVGEDEEGTLERLKVLRRTIADPKIKQHRGRVVRTMGDGLLVEFASVVDAVRCAVEIQREMALRSTDLPADRRIEFRIGINLGDIIKGGREIYGDGVNVAARLEALATPGGICVSRVVRDRYGLRSLSARACDLLSRNKRSAARGAGIAPPGGGDRIPRSRRVLCSFGAACRSARSSQDCAASLPAWCPVPRSNGGLQIASCFCRAFARRWAKWLDPRPIASPRDAQLI